VTAEIAILNKLAVALAADSAVTLGSSSQTKIYNTVNKLFTLSKYHPVGIMVYGNAEFMGVPWETIIKAYRSRLGRTEFPTLREYLQSFLTQIEADDVFPLAQEENEFVRQTIGSYFVYVRGDIDKQVQDAITKAGKITDNEVLAVAVKVIGVHWDKLHKAPRLPSIPVDHEATIIEMYSDVIRQTSEDVFQELRMDPVTYDRLREVAVAVLARDVFPRSASGVVIAGFGSEDLYPCLESVKLHGRVAGRLRYKQDESAIITSDMGAAIVPFAQSEMVQTFMEGVDPTHKQAVASFLEEVVRAYPEAIAATLADLNEEEKVAFLSKWQDLGQQLIASYKAKMEQFTQGRFINPVIDTVGALPKDELAAMAEALVNLTSFKRRVTPEAETVGGPIDVAVVSKGDGFVWIKRKHYFTAELNPHFTANYFRERAVEIRDDEAG
jgi:hypothetical protein